MKYMIFFFTVIFSLTLYASDKAKTVTLSVSGMTCQSCVSTVEKALKKVEGVKEVKVDLKGNKATVILTNSATTPAVLIKAVTDAGFKASEGTSTSKKEMKKESKSSSEDCDSGCCGDECDTDTKPVKEKKSEQKKS